MGIVIDARKIFAERRAKAVAARAAAAVKPATSSDARTRKLIEAIEKNKDKNDDPSGEK